MWGVNHIVSGRLRYRIDGLRAREMMLDPERPGRVGPEVDASGRPRRSGAYLHEFAPQNRLPRFENRPHARNGTVPCTALQRALHGQAMGGHRKDS
ncbi:hypothetical protein WMF20_38595 [Sorangium sp. So ce834]